MRALGVSVAWSALLGCGTAARRNVLFLSIDDRNDWTGDFGAHPQERTPHIDALGRRGVLFTNAHSSATSYAAARSYLPRREPNGIELMMSGWNALGQLEALRPHFLAVLPSRRIWVHTSWGQLTGT